MSVLVTGANGFIGKNLIIHLNEKGIKSIPFTRGMSFSGLSSLLGSVDFIFHLAGVNRPKNDLEFIQGNKEVTEQLCDLIRQSGRSIPILYTSTIQAEFNTFYGRSKLAAEDVLLDYGRDTKSPVYIYRLPNTFGKWSRPNYNSVVATFCHSIANDIPINVNDANRLINLVYIDDLIKDFIRLLDEQPSGILRPEILPLYTISIGGLAECIKSFKTSRLSLLAERVGVGLERALYATYLSFISPDNFSYPIPSHSDSRGRFVEMLKTKDSGQFSFFTAHPGVTRGGHYHHSKNEKFLVVQGKSRFCFRNILTNESYEIFTDAEFPQIVETVPGWAHDITNIGDNEMIVLIWANEIFDCKTPDTISHKV
ncbi:MAG: NAD-dependent epimerase/dehydratase family protein [Methylophilaceae bacterium]|nr:NAD-dependent epimerase/dehydratase family protein [Methylophilaceae bacterium]